MRRIKNLDLYVHRGQSMVMSATIEIRKLAAFDQLVDTIGQSVGVVIRPSRNVTRRALIGDKDA